MVCFLAARLAGIAGTLDGIGIDALGRVLFVEGTDVFHGVADAVTVVVFLV